ncbi:cilia- and flagella-associated protein 57 [Genypterus blacodes]|uniref:cilia- and flagella-associated protein 57 n=1 Tax=Genypterus blacodes TaxID=154954 RepID=UPI003F7697DB
MAAIIAQPHFTFGLRSGVTNNLFFIDEQTVIFPCGNNCVCYNTVQRSQRFIPGTEKSRSMDALAISANRRYLAVSERGEKATVTVYDLQHEQGRKRKVLSTGNLPAQEFVCMAFSPDSKYLIGQAGGPDWTLIFWLWEKQKILATVKTSSSTNPVSQVSFNPHNNLQICVSGAGVFKLFRYSEGTLKQSSFAKVETIDFLCHAWMSEERAIAGTSTGRLLVFESGDLRKEINTGAVPVLQQSDRELQRRKLMDSDVDQDPVDPVVPRITAILSYSRGFACSVGLGTVCLFEKTEEDAYRKTKEILIPPDPCSNELSHAEGQEIATMCLSPSEELLAVTTERGQVYSVSLTSAEMSKGEQVPFEFLSQTFHSKAVTGLSVCIRKPLIATSSLDRSVHIWNYHTKMLELYKEFLEEAFSIALHPSGLVVLVGFSDKLRLMNLLIDDIHTFKEFTVRGCRECAFSHGGHMFAAVNGNVIHIYSVTTFENLLNLKGHNGKVQAIQWSPDDSRLVSCGTDGAVYEWNTHTGKREAESVIKSCSYTGVAFSSDSRSSIAVGTDFTLKEIQDCQVMRELPPDDVAHTAVAVSRSGRVVFTGTSSGSIRVIKYPLPIQRDWIQYQAHCGSVTKMAITFDEQFLLTASEDGCLFLWKIIDKEGRGLKGNKHIVYTEEILATKSDLEEKKQNMLELKMRVDELQMEKEYQLRLKDINFSEKIKELSEKFIQQIESLRSSKQVMSTEMEKCEREHQERSAEVTDKHSRELQDLESSYSQKLIVEHERYQDLQQQCVSMQEDHSKQLKALEKGKSCALEELKQSYEARLQEKTQLLAQFQDESRQRTFEFEETIKQMNEDGDQELHSIRIQYERKLRAEQEANMKLKGETGIMTQKLFSLQRQIDDRCTDINKLKQERQKLHGLVRSLENDIEDLKRQISGHEKTNQDKDKTISSLKKMNQELEKLKFVLDFKLNDLKKQIEPQQEDINKKEEKIQQMEAELMEFHKSNTQLKLSVSELKLRLTAREKELHKEMEKVKDLETHLRRFKTELHTCVSFIQEPKKLKDSVKKLYARYVQYTDVMEQVSEDADSQRALCRQQEHQEKTIATLKIKLAKASEEHESSYVSIMKENVSLVTEVNALRKELQLVRSQLKKISRSHRKSQEVPKKEPTRGNSA